MCFRIAIWCRDLRETIESGPLYRDLCITDLFQNKSVAYFECIVIFTLRMFYMLLSFILCIFLVQKPPQKVAYLWQLGVFFFSAAPTAQNSPELHFRFMNFSDLVPKITKCRDLQCQQIYEHSFSFSSFTERLWDLNMICSVNSNIWN